MIIDHILKLAFVLAVFSFWHAWHVVYILNRVVSLVCADSVHLMVFFKVVLCVCVCGVCLIVNPADNLPVQDKEKLV